MLEMVVHVAAMAVFLWAVTFQLPRARRNHDALAIISSVLTAAAALFLVFFVGVATIS